jgi:ATP-dependent Lon protease
MPFNPKKEARKSMQRKKQWDRDFSNFVGNVGAGIVVGSALLIKKALEEGRCNTGTAPKRYRVTHRNMPSLETAMQIPTHQTYGGTKMTELDKKILDSFPGKAVRKDLTAMMKKGANVPTYVLEYLLGMYCATDDEEAIEKGIGIIRKILSENYVRPDQSEYVKSKIKENGMYTIIDKITVELDDREDKYIARFTNLRMDPFEVNSDLVVHNEKLLIGGIWCIMRIEYVGLEKEDQEEFEEDIFGDQKGRKKTKKKKKRSKYESPFRIASLKPIQMPNLDLEEMMKVRKNFTKDEWISLLMKSAGYEPTDLTEKQKMHYLLRFVPFIQKNYNLVELGPRGTGKSHVYSELSPYSILMSSGNTTVSNMFYNMASRKVGLVGNWDCIAFDEVGGITETKGDMVQIMKNYMANGSFARGSDSISSDASIAFEGNTFRSVADMMRTTNLFEPFPEAFNNDSAFFDRIHAYLPGWETPKLRSSLFTKGYGLISDCFSEFCHVMRKYDFTNSYSEYFELNDNYNTRDSTAVGRTFSGLAKLIYPDEKMTKEECREILEYAIECRRRVKEQLRKMNPAEFSDVQMGYIDLDTNEEIIVNLPEVTEGSLVFDGYEKAGFVYAVGRSVDDKIGVYRLENKLIEGTGLFSSKNVEGLARSPKSVKDSLRAAFNYFSEHTGTLNNRDASAYDYSLYFNDLQNRNVCDEVSVAEVVGLFSALSGKSVMPSLVICGKVVMSGSMMPITSELEEIFVAAANAGAENIMLPIDCESDYHKLSQKLKDETRVIFYSTPLDAAKKALGVD